MAIVDLKRLLLAGDIRDREALLLKLQRMGCIQVTPFEEEEKQQATPARGRPGSAQLDQEVQRLRWAINRLSKYDKGKKGMFIPKPEVALHQMVTGEEETQEVARVLTALEGLERQSGELRALQTRLQMQIQQLTPWEGLDISPRQVRETATHHQFLGSLSHEALQELCVRFAEQPVLVEVVGQQRDEVNLWAAAHTSAAGAFAAALKEAGFVPAQLGDFAHTPAQEIAHLKQQQDEAENTQQSLEAAHEELAVHLPRLRRQHDAVLGEKARAQAREELLHTRQTFLLRGWVPAHLEQRVLSTLQQEFPAVIAQVSPPKPGDNPPVLLKNNPVVTPFESVVEGFAMPAFDSIDPTAMMMPFFAAFFGMMVSDGGYGLMMVLLIPLLMKLMKPTGNGRKLFLLLAIGGVFTMFWGFMFNTWFGFSPLKNPIFDPIFRPMEVMILCLALGAVHLLAGLVMAAVLNIRRKQYIDILYDQVSWLVLLAGLGLLVVPSLSEAGKWLAIAGAAIIVLTAGRDKTRNPFKRLISGLGALYGVTNWVSDLLSYMRLFGMGLATGIIGMVINILVGMLFQMGPVGWVPGILLFVGMHLFNAGINILGAYVHACRLQYIEFFSKFFEEGDAPFRPLQFMPRFVRISDAP